MNNKKPYQLIVIGTSQGGLEALKLILSQLPRLFSIPLAIVQHRVPSMSKLPVKLLQKHCSITISLIEDKLPIERGYVYLAPGGYHSFIEGNHFALSLENPFNFAIPSIDLFFESAAYYYGDKTIGIILTGANNDGAAGLAKIKEAGGLTIVQDPKEAESRKMPDAAIDASKVDYILTLEKIGEFLNEGISQ